MCKKSRIRQIISRLSSFLSLFACFALHAQNARFTLSNIQTSPDLMELLTSAGLELNSEWSQDYQPALESQFLENMSHTLSHSHASQGIGYSQDYDHMNLALTAGLGYQQGASNLRDVLSGKGSIDELSAVSAQYGMTVGLRFQKEQSLRWSFGFAQLKLDDSGIDIESDSFFVHTQIELWGERSVGSPLLVFGGARLGTGLRYTDLSALYRGTIRHFDSGSLAPLKTLGVDGLSLSAEADVYAASDFDVWTLPIEFSSSIRAFQAFSFYSLTALDLSWSKAGSRVVIDGPLSVQDSEGKTLAGAMAEWVHVEDARPKHWEVRSLLGLQIEMGYGAVYAHYQRSFRQEADAASVGFRAFF